MPTYNSHNFAIKDFAIQDKNPVRPELAGVFVSPKETCATDSFAMIKVSPQVKDAVNFEPFVLPADQAGLLEKNQNPLGLITSEHFKLLPKITEKFPEYDAIFQEQSRYVEITINPKFLEKIAKFYKRFNPKELKMKVPCDDNTRPVRFYAETETKQTAEALLMPIMSSETKRDFHAKGNRE